MPTIIQTVPNWETTSRAHQHVENEGDKFLICLKLKDYQPQAAMSQRGLSPYTPRMAAVNNSQSSSSAQQQQHPAAPHLAELASNYDKKRKEQQSQQQQRRFAAHRAQQQQHGQSKRSSALLADQQHQHARERRQPEVRGGNGKNYLTLVNKKLLQYPSLL